MKVKIGTREFGGKVTIQGGYTEISSESCDFSVLMEEVEISGVKSVYVFPRELRLQIEQEDGWIIQIDRDIYEKEYLTVTRFKIPEVGQVMDKDEYLTKKGEWMPRPPGYGPYPSNIMKIPIPILKEVQV